MAKNADWYVTVAGAGLKDGTDWANAFDEPAYEIHKEGAVVAGDYHWIMDGAYTLDSDVDSNARNGTAVSPVLEIGVKTGTTNEPPVYSDWSRDPADRPFFDCVTFRIRTGAFYVMRNLDWQGADSHVLLTGADCIVENCKLDNDYAVGSAVRFAIETYGNGIIINNEIIASNEFVSGLHADAQTRVIFNYFHDFTDGVNGIAVFNGGNHTVILFNIFDNCTIGISSTSLDRCTVMNNTFYETDTGLSETDGFTWACINNIMEGNDTAGFVWTTQTDINFFWKNHGNDVRCTDMWDLVAITPSPLADHEVVTGDPVFDVPGADFALQNGSPDLDVGMSIEIGVG